MTIDTPKNTDERGMSRRTLMKAGAWSAPVIAVAVATPLAAASIENVNTRIGVSNNGNLTVGNNAIGGSVNVAFAGSATVANSGPGWDIDDASVSFQVSGPVADAEFQFNGSPIGSTITSGGYTWSVVANEAGYLELGLLAPKPIPVPANGSTLLPYPPVTYVTTLTNTATTARRVQAIANFTVFSNGESIYDGNIKRFPA